MTWHEIMAYAHQGVELKQIPGLGGPARPSVAEARQGVSEGGRPVILSRRGTDALLRVERMMDDASRALATSREPSKTTQGPAAQVPETVAAAPAAGDAQ
jgi:penicillin-binding protein 1A